MKKITAALLLCMLAISMVPLALAEDTNESNEDNQTEDDENSGRNKITKDALEDRRDEKEDNWDKRENKIDRTEDKLDRMNADRRRCIERCEAGNNTNCERQCNIKDNKEDIRDEKEDVRDIRENIKDRREDNKENRRERLENAKNKFEEAKDRFENAKKEFKDSMRSGNNETRMEHSKEVLLQSADVIINHLGRMITKIEDNDKIDEGTSVELIEKIQAEIDAVEQIKTDIEAADSMEEIKAAAKELREKWKNLKRSIKVFAHHIVWGHMNGIIMRAEALEEKLEKALDRLVDDGGEVDVSAELETFSNLIDSAKAAHEEAKELLLGALDAEDQEDRQALVDQGQAKLKEARDDLKQAHDTLKEIVKKIRDAGLELDLSEGSEESEGEAA